jgi:hypothetical protein
LVQTLQRERERRVRARVAARLFSGDLARAQHDIGIMLEVGNWPDLSTKYGREVDVWIAERVAFAAAVSVWEYTRVAVAYQDLVDLPGVSELGRTFTAEERTMLAKVRKRIDQGYNVAANCSAEPSRF